MDSRIAKKYFHILSMRIHLSQGGTMQLVTRLLTFLLSSYCYINYVSKSV